MTYRKVYPNLPQLDFCFDGDRLRVRASGDTKYNPDLRGIKRMKTRWGTCNQKAGRIWLNLELAKKPEHCLEFIIVHKLTHLLERSHNDRFKAYLDRLIPRWRQHKEELSRSVLSHESWNY